MDSNMNSYQALKDVYTFLNREMKHFEATKELQQAVEQLMMAMGIYFFADTVQLYKKEQEGYRLACAWPKGSEEHGVKVKSYIEILEPIPAEKPCIIMEDRKDSDNKLTVIPLVWEGQVFALLAVVNRYGEKTELLSEISGMLGTWLANRFVESEKKSSKAKNEFLSRMSHDVRTPLNGIIGLLEQGERHPDDLQMIAENRKKAHIAANHLLELFNDIIELNKLDYNDIELREEPFDFSELMKEVETIVNMQADECGITVFVEPADLKFQHPYVYGSSLYVRQILVKVMTNAIKYNRVQGSVWCKLTEKRLSNRDVEFAVSVTDNGIGMSEEFLENIYEPFAQESHDARSEYSGGGLGMPIVKSLVDRMGGTIVINSKAGEGTKVEITLPFRTANRQEISYKEENFENGSLRGISALVVEDNELNMEIAKCMLEDEDMTVKEAHNGEEAVRVFDESPAGTFDIILMDIMMPVMDGLMATRKIRELNKEDAKTIPIFSMTAHAFSEDIEKIKAAGMNEHIAKPIEMKYLMKKIYQYCG